MKLPYKEEYQEMPFRNSECVFYDQCLTIAAHNNKRLDCTGCQRYLKAEREEVISLLPYARLLFSIFFSDRVSRGNVGKRKRAGAYVKAKARI